MSKKKRTDLSENAVFAGGETDIDGEAAKEHNEKENATDAAESEQAAEHKEKRHPSAGGTYRLIDGKAVRV